MRWRYLTPTAFVALASSLKLEPPSDQAAMMNQTRQRRQAFDSCEAAIQSCSDQTSYPNIAAGLLIIFSQGHEIVFI